MWGTYKVLRAVIDDVKQRTAPAPNDLPAALWKFFQPAQDAPRELIPGWMNGGYPPEAWNLSITTYIPKGADAAQTTDPSKKRPVPLVNTCGKLADCVFEVTPLTTVSSVATSHRQKCKRGLGGSLQGPLSTPLPSRSSRSTPWRPNTRSTSQRWTWHVDEDEDASDWYVDQALVARLDGD